MKLKELREKHEWTIKKLAEIIQVRPDIIQVIEAGESVDWHIAESIRVRIRNYLGDLAIEGLDIPVKNEEQT